MSEDLDLAARVEALEKRVEELHDEVWAELGRYAEHINETFATLSENLTKSVTELLAPVLPLVAVLGGNEGEADEDVEPCESCGAELTETDEVNGWWTCPECGHERWDASRG